MEQRLSSRDLSFDPAPDADEEDGSYSPSAYLQHPEADPSVAVEREQWDEDTAERLSQALETLDDRSQHILRSRWMQDEKSTLHEARRQVRRVRGAYSPDRGERDQETAWPRWLTPHERTSGLNQVYGPCKQEGRTRESPALFFSPDAVSISSW